MAHRRPPFDQNRSRNANWKRLAFVPSGCDPSLFGTPKFVRAVSGIGVESGGGFVAVYFNPVAGFTGKSPSYRVSLKPLKFERLKMSRGGCAQDKDRV